MGEEPEQSRSAGIGPMPVPSRAFLVGITKRGRREFAVAVGINC
jgi:hypothetical protein